MSTNRIVARSFVSCLGVAPTVRHHRYGQWTRDQLGKRTGRPDRDTGLLKGGVHGKGQGFGIVGRGKMV